MTFLGTHKKLQMKPECEERSKEASVNLNLTFLSCDLRPWPQGRFLCFFQDTVNCQWLDVMY